MYVTTSELREYGITDPRAEELIVPASRIIDAYVSYPVINDDGFKFPRERNYYYGIQADDEIPTVVQWATCEQIAFMLREGTDYLSQGGDNAIATNTLGASKVKPTPNTRPMLAPMARLFLGGLLNTVGYA